MKGSPSVLFAYLVPGWVVITPPLITPPPLPGCPTHNPFGRSESCMDRWDGRLSRSSAQGLDGSIWEASTSPCSGSWFHSHPSSPQSCNATDRAARGLTRDGFSLSYIPPRRVCRHGVPLNTSLCHRMLQHGSNTNTSVQDSRDLEPTSTTTTVPSSALHFSCPPCPTWIQGHKKRASRTEGRQFSPSRRRRSP